jgi:transposase-like protein
MMLFILSIEGEAMGRGRPAGTGKLNKGTIETLCAALERGASYRTACQCAGINESTLYRWLRNGRRAKYGRFKDFLNAVEAAEGRAKLMCLETIGHAIQVDKNWKAALALLERREPEGYGRTNRVEIDARVETESTLHLSTEKASQLIEALPDEALALLDCVDDGEDDAEEATLH